MAYVIETKSVPVVYKADFTASTNGVCTIFGKTTSGEKSRLVTRSPVRPTRRAKPEQLLFNPTPYGPFYKHGLVGGYHEASFLTSVKCPGTSSYVPAIKTLCLWDLPDDLFMTVTPNAPPWEIAMRNKIKADRLCLADSIGEWRETADAVSGGAKALRNAMRYMRQLVRMPRSRWPGELRHLFDRRRTLTVRDIPGAYLCTVFGVVPWVDLANEVGEKLAIAASAGIVKRYSVTRKRSDVLDFPGIRGGSLRVQVDKTTRAVFLVRHRADGGSFTTGNVLESLWAGVPMSFMIDWFVGVGSWLSAIDALADVDMSIGTVTTRERRTCIDMRKGGRFSALPSNLQITDHRHGSGFYQYYNRVVTSTIGFPLHLEWQPTPTLGKLISTLAVLHELRR